MSQSSPGVSCLCLTYGRPHLLEESVESFLRQDWTGPKELVIVNDHPDQPLVFDHPEVRVHNLGKRVQTLGEKRNLSVSLARHDNLLIWDDDDLYLPWRITETMKILPTAQFFKCPNAWLIDHRRWHDRPAYNLFHGGTAYTRWLFDAAGGYPSINSGEDAAIEKAFGCVAPGQGHFRKLTTLPWTRIYYIYRWGHGSYHATNARSLSEIAPAVKPGTVTLRPRWDANYTAQAMERARRQDHPSAPNLMPFQWEPFNGDPHIQNEFLRLKQEYQIDVAVETGSCLFSTTTWLASKFGLVYAIEINDAYRKAGQYQIEGKANVVSALGDSASFLRQIMPKLTDRTIFFLDAQWNNVCPLQDELKAIAAGRIRPVIAIHDFKVPGHPELGFDVWNAQPFTFEWLKPCFDAIYGERRYRYHYNSQAGGAKRGIIYLTPA